MDSVLEEVETVYTLIVVSFSNLACLLPLANFFIFSSFLILPNLFSPNTSCWYQFNGISRV